jgi:hypothetical protein
MKRLFNACSLMVLASLINSCGSELRSGAKLTHDSQPAHIKPVTDVVEIEGSDANSLFSALENLGVQDTDHLIGATNLRIKNLRCDKDLANPARKTRCNYDAVNAETGSLESFSGIVGKASDDLFTILSKHGLNVNAGINPNYRAVAASVLTCSMPVIPNPVAFCVVERL